MPFGDRTGPLGQGPMTGRGAGSCAGLVVPGNTNPGFGRGIGRGGMGMGACGAGGRGRRNRFFASGLPGWQRAAATGTVTNPAQFATAAQDQESAALKNQVESLHTALNQILQRLDELSAKPKA